MPRPYKQTKWEISIIQSKRNYVRGIRIKNRLRKRRKRRGYWQREIENG